MEVLVVILYFVAAALGLWLTVLGLVVGHRWLAYHPPRQANMPKAVWTKQRDAANGVTWPLANEGHGAPSGKVWDGKDIADFNG